METLYKPIFLFSKDIPHFSQQLAIYLFMYSRKFAVEALNPMYEKWNEEFNNLGEYVIDENDELKDYGGTKYCEFIRNKSREVLKRVNKKHPVTNWELDCDEICDIVFRHKKDKDLTLTMELQPVNN